MLELKWLGALMVVPTVFLAVYIVYKTLQSTEVYLNIAVFFWISANSFWMLMEFFNNNQYKHFAAIPFALGFVFVIIFYLTTYRKKQIRG